MRPSSPIRFVSCLLCAAFVASCGGGEDGVGVDGSVASVQVSPGAATLNSLGSTTQLSASATSGSGSAVSGTTFT